MEEEKLSSIDVREMALKCTTKAEVYKVLTTTGGIYLPQVDQINCDFIRDILSGEKLVSFHLTRKYIECSKVKIIELPHIEGLRIPDLLEFASQHCAINRYMPEYECKKYPSRKWICNFSEFLMYHLSIVNSLIQDRFKQFVDGKLTESNDKIDKKHENKFSVLPVMAKVFAETKFISKRRGRFHQRIKNSKKRRTDKDNNIEQERKKQEMIDYMEQQANEIEKMQEELDDCRNRLEDHSKDTDLLKNLYDKGYIDEAGNPIKRSYEMN